MKICVLLVTICSLAVVARANESVPFSQLPAAVKQRVDALTLGEPIKRITVEKQDARATYDLELENKLGPNAHVQIAENGEVLRNDLATGVLNATPLYPDLAPIPPPQPRLRFDELPRPAQDAIRRNAGNQEIAVIHEDAIGNRKAYAVEFREPGRNPWLFVAEDGTILHPKEKEPVLGLGTTFSDTPVAVQRKIRHEIGDGEILKIDKETRLGKPTAYKVEIRDAHGTYELRLSANGDVLEDTRPKDRTLQRG